ncbi:hypothetical protein SK128_006192, partial [Halocaridina rubra]
MGMQALSMDMNHPDNTISFSKKKGCYISRCAAVVYSILFISSVVATGLLVYYYLPQISGVVNDVREFFHKESNQEKHAYNIPIQISTTTMRMELPTEDSEKRTINQSPTTTFPPSSPSTVEKKWSMRLPRTVKPLHYIVKLQPFVNGNFSIKGYVEIEIEALEATSNITLHIADIITHNETITLTRLNQGREVAILPVEKHEFDSLREFYIAHLKKPLDRGSHYKLKMGFRGYLNDNMKGFYRSTYTDDDGNQKFLAATQFQASDARRAFPCFDEPGIKATFEIFLAREENMNSVSNMPVVETIPVSGENGWVWDRFNTTVPMSTYLIAFAISDFASKNVTNENWMFRVWARESALQQAEYAFDIGPKMLKHFEDFFQIPFPLPKVDMIALPDFAPGAMENWGLITFRETLMLYHPRTSSAFNKQLVAQVTGHELAHQWFGNLVTPQWWTDIWLNEGFASYVEYIGVDYYAPTNHRAYKGGILFVSPPEKSPVVTYHNMSEYKFEASLILSPYLSQYSNAEQDDLWHYLTLAAHEDQILPLDLTVKTVMDTWTLQMGYPVIKVTRSSDGTSAVISQERFLLSKKANSTDDHDYKWWVPLTYTSQGLPDFQNTKTMIWMKPSEPEITIVNLPPENQWLIFNLQQTGFYRVNYDEKNWMLIENQLLQNHSVIHTINRAQVLDDAMNFARAGHLPYNTSLSLYKYLSAEDQYAPWAAALNNLAYIRRMFASTPGYGALKQYLLSLVLPLYESVGFEDSSEDPLLSQYKRQKGLSWACVLEHPDCLEKSVALYHKWMQNPANSSIISPNLKSMVYCRAIQEGGEEEWNFAWQQYLLSNVGSEKEQLLSGMGCSRKLWMLSRYLEMAFTSESGIRKQDSYRVFSAVATNPVGTPIAWNYLREHFNRIHS